MRTTHHGALSRRAWVPVVVLLVSLGCAACGSSGDGASSTDGSELFLTAEEVGLKLATEPGKRYPLADGEPGRLNDADDALAAWKAQTDLKVTVFKDDSEEDVVRRYTGTEAAAAALSLTWSKKDSPCGSEARRPIQRQGIQLYEDENGDGSLGLKITEFESDGPIVIEKENDSSGALHARVSFGETTRSFDCSQTADVGYIDSEEPTPCHIGDECWLITSHDGFTSYEMRVGRWQVSLWGDHAEGVDFETLLKTIADRLPT